MPDPHYTPLAHRALVTVSGEDRFTFLQGMVSNDVKRVEGGAAIWAALLTPQGKFLHEFFLIPHEETIWIECERERRDDLVTRLKRYTLRSKVEIVADEALAAGALWGDGAFELIGLPHEAGAVKRFDFGVVYADPRLVAAGARWVLPAAEVEREMKKLGAVLAPVEDHERNRLELGLPDGSRDLEIEKALLLENGFEELQGVNFDKGCYVGQELTARTHYRALIKKRLMPVLIDGPTPAPGTPLTASVDGGAPQEAGEMKSASGHLGLALVRLDAWKASGAGALQAGEAKVTPMVPAWMTLQG